MSIMQFVVMLNVVMPSVVMLNVVIVSVVAPEKVIIALLIISNVLKLCSRSVGAGDFDSKRLFP
jgi:hypothetical protein